ncbi:hypothetical protein Ancab_004366 [Ancistrocladus abbreviatus]
MVRAWRHRRTLSMPFVNAPESNEYGMVFSQPIFGVVSIINHCMLMEGPDFYETSFCPKLETSSRNQIVKCYGMPQKVEILIIRWEPLPHVTLSSKPMVLFKVVTEQVQKA